VTSFSLSPLIGRKSASARRQSTKLRLSRRFAPLPDFLEARITPTGNIAMTGASLVSSSGSPLGTVNAGNTVDILADYTTTNLPSGSSYSINFEVNGLILNSGPLTSGAGSSGTQTWTYNSNTASDSFTATPGTNQVIVNIDPAQSVVESSYADNLFSFTFNAGGPNVVGIPLTAAQMRTAYGINSIANFGSATPDGSGQTIAIVDAGNDPTSLGDLDGYDQAMSLTTTSSESIYQQYGAASSFLNVYNQAGTNITAEIANSGSGGVPAVDPGWYDEISLDIEWAHTIAPGAKIDLIEADSDEGNNFDLSEVTAAKLPGVSVVSNSWGGGEYSGELSEDANFLTPSGHNGVTFLASTGDDGAPGGYPAYSPNVVAVGGTQLTLASNGYSGETGWNLPTPRTLNNGSSSYSQSGSWTSTSGGYSGTYSVASAGSSASATWTTAITAGDQGNGGETAVSVTWVASPTNATNATYTIYDGSQSGGTILGTVTVNQTKAPVGTPEGNTEFQELGQFASSTGTLTVVLNAGTANGKVVADAIGIAAAAADGGGVSLFEPEPSYQLSVQNTGFRTIPDVSFDASVDSPVIINESSGLIYGIAGTSLACPCWAGLIAIVNQDRISEGGQTLNSSANPLQALQGLYSIPTSDFHDITSGYNGFSAEPGYDEDTGIGSPIANLLVPDLSAFDNLDDLVVTAQPPGNVAAGNPFGFSVTVESSLGIRISTYNGPVTISLGNDPSDATLGGTLTVNAINGVATFSGLTLDAADDGYTIDVTGTKLTSTTTASFNVVAGSPSELVVSAQPPSTVTAGSPFGLSVTFEDAYGNIVTGDIGNVTVGFGTNPGTGTLGGTEIVSAVDGVATFTGLTITQADIGYTLSLSATGVTGVTTTPMTINPAIASQLVITEAPRTNAIAGVMFSLEVAIEDLYGNIETGNDTSVVTASLQIGAGPLQGTMSVTASDGIATFTNLADDKAVTIALNFSSPTLTGANSTNLVINPAPATQLIIQDEPSPSATVGHPFTIQPLIYEEDQFGNLESNDSSTLITASLASGAGPLMGTTSAVISDGAAKFTNLEDNDGENITIKFSGGTLKAVFSNGIAVSKLIPTIALSSAAATSTYKQSMTFTAFVTPPSGGTTPTGSVMFLDGSTVLGSSGLNASGQAKFSTTALPLGTQAITAVYSGNTVNASVTSSTNSLYVGDLVDDDFDGDGKSDLAVYGLNPTVGKYGFTILTSSSDFTKTTFFDNNGYGYGNAQSIPVPGDYFGDGQDAYALWTPNSLGGMTFTAISSVTGKSVTANFGGVNDIPVVADIDGDGKDDFGIYGYLQGYGYCFDFLLSSDNFNVNAQYIFNNYGYGFGNAQSIPVVGNFDGSGHANFGVYTPSSTGTTFAYADPSTNTSFIETLSPMLVTANDTPVAVDYDGSGKSSLALYGPDPTHPGQYRYLVLTASTNFNPNDAVTYDNNGYGYGNSFSIPVIADYDGTGKDDFGVFSPDFTGGMEYVFQTDQTGAAEVADFATLTEIPLTASTYLMAKKVRSL
jgi:Bacterial Ig-like domain (group 3)